MSSTGPSKSDGQYDSVVGNLKNTAGSAVGNESLQSRGSAQHHAGEGQIKAAETKGYLEGAIDSVTGKAKDVVGAITGDTSKQAEGKVQHTKGDAQRSINS